MVVEIQFNNETFRFAVGLCKVDEVSLNMKAMPVCVTALAEHRRNKSTENCNFSGGYRFTLPLSKTFD